MSNIPCEIIRDLMPSYCDGICNGTTKDTVEAHIAECDDCRNALAVMGTQIRPEPVDEDADRKNLEHLFKRWLRIRKVAFLKGWLITAAVTAVLLGIGYLELVYKRKPVPPGSVTFEAYMLENGDIACDFKYPGYEENESYIRHYGHNYIRASSSHDNQGQVNFILQEPILMPGEPQIIKTAYEVFDTDSSALPNADMPPITSIYYGGVDDQVLIWMEGVALPQAPFDIQKTYGDAFGDNYINEE
jgi:hypothetical protein